MRNIAIACIFVGFSHYANAGSYCDDVGNLGKTVMAERQNNGTLEESFKRPAYLQSQAKTLEKVNPQSAYAAGIVAEYTEIMILDAFSRSVESASADKQIAIDRFGKEMLNICLENQK